MNWFGFSFPAISQFFRGLAWQLQLPEQEVTNGDVQFNDARADNMFLWVYGSVDTVYSYFNELGFSDHNTPSTLSVYWEACVHEDLH